MIVCIDVDQEGSDDRDRQDHKSKQGIDAGAGDEQRVQYGCVITQICKKQADQQHQKTDGSTGPQYSSAQRVEPGNRLQNPVHVKTLLSRLSLL